MKSKSSFVVAALILTLCIAPSARAEPMIYDAALKRQRDQQDLLAILQMLEGQSLTQQTTIDWVVSNVSQFPHIMDRVSVIESSIRDSNSTNKKEDFLKALKDELCKVDKTICAERKRIDHLEERLRQEAEARELNERELNRIKNEYADLMSKLERERSRIEQLERNTFFRGNPNNPTPAAPVPQSSIQSPPRATVDLIVASRNSICANSQLVQQCFDYYTDGTRYYHGNLYVDCSGRRVLVVHTKTRR